MNYTIFISSNILSALGGAAFGYLICSEFGHSARIVKEYFRNKSEESNLQSSDDDDNSTESDSNSDLSESDSDDFLDDVFDQAQKNIKPTEKQILEAALAKKPEKPSGGLIGIEGGNMTGYATVQQLQSKDDIFTKSLLNAEEHENLIEFWTEKIKGKLFHEAKTIVEDKGFSLYPIKVNSARRILNKHYDPTIVSVHVSDSDYDYLTKTPSAEAVVLDVLGMGGQNSV